MKTQHIIRLLSVGAVVSIASLSPEADAATFLMSDVTHWIGPAAGAGVNEAVMVIQWPGELNGLAWGYRWDASETKTGFDMLQAMADASNGALVTVGGPMVSDIQWGGMSFPGYNGSEYLQYFVNNAQVDGNYVDGDSSSGGAHVLPPLGSPYDESGPGEWVASNTGLGGRPLVNGSWDGWMYAAFGSPGLDQAIDAPTAIPEPSSLLLLTGAALTVCFRRRRAA